MLKFDESAPGVSLDVWQFRANGSLAVLLNVADPIPMAGSWLEVFTGPQLALWTGEAFSSPAGIVMSGVTLPGDGRTLLASGTWGFDIAIFKFQALGFGISQGCVFPTGGTP